MPYKQLFFRACVAPPLLADAVRVTLGPKSKPVLIGKKWGWPIGCNDGVTIAKPCAALLLLFAILRRENTVFGLPNGLSRTLRHLQGCGELKPRDR